MSFAPASVLAVDDNATIRRAIAMRLSAKGFQVTTADSGRQALAALDKRNFDLMLLDLQMPDMQGDEVLRKVRGRFSETELPVIMLAASDDKKDISKTLALGANDYVIKPGDLPVLLARIKTQLSLRDTSQRLQRHELTLTRSLPGGDQTLPTGTQGGLNVRMFDGTWTFNSSGGADQRYSLLYDHTPMTCFTLNSELELVFANRFGLQFLGFSSHELRDSPAVNWYAEVDKAVAQEYLRGVLERPDRLHRWEIRRTKRNGTTLWMRETARVVGSGRDAMILMTCEDIDDTYKMAEKLTYNATHDLLTGLSNRKFLEQRLGQVIDSAQTERSQHAFAIIDIDQFKIINDTCGYLAGDELLKEAATVLKNVVRKRDMIARVGGDEFGVLFEDCAPAQAQVAVEHVRETLAAHPFEWNGAQHRITASVGLVHIDNQAESVSAVLSKADTACYAAKDAGRNRTHIYCADNANVLTRHGEMRWATRINDALRDDRFELCLQPIMPALAADESGDHYELLIRMRDENGKLVMPGEFLPAAERYNLANKIDRWVIKHAIDWLRATPAVLNRLHLCGINLSGQSFGDEDMLKFITAELDAPGADLTGKICFEVTETAAISDIERANRFIGTLKDRGCLFALDDFGSGFSSFSYLKNLPVDFVKIDGSFVRDIARDTIDLAMVRSINDIGHVLGKRTIAEFVENQGILELLREMGVDYVQGYEVGRPILIRDYAAA